MEEYERSCEMVQVVRTREKVYPEGRKEGGKPITERWTDTYKKKQYPRTTLSREMRMISHELTVLAAGYLGPGNGSIACDKVGDPDEVDRWDRAVKERDEIIEELDRELEARGQETGVSVGCMSGSEMHADSVPVTAVPSPQSNISSRVHFAEPHAPYRGDSERPKNGPAVTQLTSNPSDVITSECAPYDEADRRSCPVENASPKVTQNPLQQGEETREEPGVRSQESGVKLNSAEPPAPPQPLYRWSDAHRQEALDLHCRLHKLPRAKLDQASGIPDPKNMTPREYVELSRPYCISIDRSEEENRLWKLNQHRFDEIQAEMLSET